ncbi:MAG: hypothetical protein RLY47_68 [Candidatus Parcubacteria bacterium]|jgi:uncharacterized membrane protein YjfL (UPF0719 family)
MKKHLSIYLGGALGLAAFAPSFAHAAINCSDSGTIVDIESFLCSFEGLINFLTGVVAALALLVFFWGLTKYIAKADDEKAKESGKNIMIWGVLALFVMFSVFGLVSFLQTSFGTTEDIVTPPRL